MSRGTLGLARAYEQLTATAGLALLRADHLPVLGAVLGEHLGGTRRVMLATEFLVEVDADLTELRENGFDLPRTAQQYLADWVRQGILIRRPGTGRQETVELSASASAAISFLRELNEPRSTVNSSRLANVSTLLGSLARDTDPDQSSRLAGLHSERTRLEEEIARVERGDFASLEEAEAAERLQEILRLAAEIPTDFAQVSAELEQLNRNLKEEIVRAAGSRGHVLDTVFSGVDVITESEAGRSFEAFYSMVLDSERSAAFDDAVEDILSRPFSSRLSSQEATFLRRLLTTLQEDSAVVRAQMTGLSRSLRRFVETRTRQENQRLAAAIADGQAAVLEALTDSGPTTQTHYELPATGVPLGSVSTWKLHNPGDLRTTDPVRTQEADILDLTELRDQVRESEVDFKELQHAIMETVARHGSATVADVLKAHPATQGLASVLGLVILAERHATRTAESEAITWVSNRGVARRVRAPRFVFAEVPKEWSARPRRRPQ